MCFRWGACTSTLCLEFVDVKLHCFTWGAWIYELQVVLRLRCLHMDICALNLRILNCDDSIEVHGFWSADYCASIEVLGHGHLCLESEGFELLCLKWGASTSTFICQSDHITDDRWFVAEFAQVISNGRYTSAQHKGVVNKVQDRYSTAYFVQAPDWDQIVPFPELMDSEHPKKYRPFTWTEFLHAQARQPLIALQDFTVECNKPPPSS